MKRQLSQLSLVLQKNSIALQSLQSLHETVFEYPENWA